MAKKFFMAGLTAFIAFFVLGESAVCQEGLSNVSYPIPELGNCASKEDCRAFCDKPENYVLCTRWAAENGLVSEEKIPEVEKEAKQIEKFESGEISEGPGGCKSPEECDAYCSKPEHGEECFRFGLEHNLISPQEAEQIKKQMEEIKGPGGCKSKEECDTFCAKPENAEACINYGVKDGTLTQAEADELLAIMAREREKRRSMPPPPEEVHPKPEGPKVDKEKIVEILKKEKGPGGCLTLEECEEYCDDFSHAEECLSFVEKNNLASSKDLEQMKKMTKLMETTGGPGGCKNREECDKYCSLPEHQDECLKFAKENNLISPEEVKMMEEMKGGRGGPGGCKSQKECDIYCSNPQHMKECLDFSVKQGIMTKEDAQRMMEIMKAQEERGLQMKGAPPTGEMVPKMPHMFEKGMPKQNEWPGPGHLPESNQGPGPRFEPASGQMPEQGGAPPKETMPDMTAPNGQMMTGPGGCKSPEECDAYCSKPEHQKECREFGNGPPEMPGEGFQFQGPENQDMPFPEEQPQSLLKKIKAFLAALAGLLWQ